MTELIRQLPRAGDRVFFPIMGLAFLGISLAGFWPSFVVPLADGNPGFRSAIYLHAVIMFGWLATFIVQASLPGRGGLRLHMRIGKLAVGLFVAVWLSSIYMSVTSFFGPVPPPIRSLISNLFFLQIVAWVLSPILFVLAIRNRARSTEDHKRYMMLLTFFLIEAAMSRIRWLPGMGFEDPFFIFQYVYLDLFLVLLALYDWFSLGRLAKATVFGLVVFPVYQLIAVTVWDSAFWLGTTERWLKLVAS